MICVFYKSDLFLEKRDEEKGKVVSMEDEADKLSTELRLTPKHRGFWTWSSV